MTVPPAASSPSVPPRLGAGAIVAILLSSAVVVVPVALGLVFTGILKAQNPDGVDISQPLAYLRESLIFSWSALGAFVVGSALVNILIGRRDRRGAGIAWLVWGSQLVFGLLLLLGRIVADAPVTGA